MRGFTVRVMPLDLPTPPELLERAARGEPAALSAVVCARKERVYLLASALCGSALDESASNVAASMEQLADMCDRASMGRTRASRASLRDEAPIALCDHARARSRPPELHARQTLLKRWQLVHSLCQAVAVLPYEQRALLVLVDMEGLEGDQAAWLLGLDGGELSSRLLEARAFLRERMLAGTSDRKSA